MHHVPESPTILLRARTDADTEILYRLAADLETWEERGPTAPTTLARSAYEARLERADADDPGGVVFFVIEADGAAVGTVSLFGFDELARHAEIGIALVSDARGKGIGTRAISQLLEFAFVRRNLRRVHLEAIESNAGAIRAYEKAGFTIEGRQREHAWVRGRYEDIVRMGILRADWLAARTDRGGTR